MQYDNRSAFVKAPWDFELRDNTISSPGPGRILVEIAACGVCGTDLHYADRVAREWMPFGHEVSGTVLETGDGVTRFKEGDSVALDSSAPCGECPMCLPAPYGRGRPDLCRTPASFHNSSGLGFGRYLVSPERCAVPILEGVPPGVACLTEPVGVAIDLVRTAGVGPGDHVLVVGPGPIGLAAIPVCRRAGAEVIVLAGRSKSARTDAGLTLGVDAQVFTGEEALTDYDFGDRRPDRILVTAPPSTLADAIKVAANGACIAYVGIAWGPGAVLQFDADDFHFRKLELKGSFASPATHARESMALLADVPLLGKTLITHRFHLEEIGEVMLMAKNNKGSMIKPVMVNKAMEVD